MVDEPSRDVGALESAKWSSGATERCRGAPLSAPRPGTKAQTPFEAVGCGLELSRPKIDLGGDARMKSPQVILNANGVFGVHLKSSIVFSNNKGTPHRSGTCSGDSGGPFLPQQHQTPGRGELLRGSAELHGRRRRLRDRPAGRRRVAAGGVCRQRSPVSATELGPVARPPLPRAAPQSRAPACGHADFGRSIADQPVGGLLSNASCEACQR